MWSFRVLHGWQIHSSLPKPISKHFETGFEAYKRPIDPIVAMNCKWFFTVAIPVCTVGGLDLAEDIF